MALVGQKIFEGGYNNPKEMSSTVSIPEAEYIKIAKKKKQKKQEELSSFPLYFEKINKINNVAFIWCLWWLFLFV